MFVGEDGITEHTRFGDDIRNVEGTAAIVGSVVHVESTRSEKMRNEGGNERVMMGKGNHE